MVLLCMIGCSAVVGLFFTCLGTNARLSAPTACVVDNLNQNIYVTDAGNHVLRRYNTGTNAITTVCGSGAASFADGVAAGAGLNNPNGISMDVGGNMYIADTGQQHQRWPQHQYHFVHVAMRVLAVLLHSHYQQ